MRHRYYPGIEGNGGRREGANDAIFATTLFYNVRLVAGNENSSNFR